MSKPKLKVHLIDTDAELLFNLERYLNQEGFTVLTSTNSADAVQLAEKEKPALVLVELEMPDMDGIEVCLELKNQQNLKDSLIVFHSKISEDYAQIAAFSAGADDYIIKPVKPRVLISRIKALLKRHVVSKQSSVKKEVSDILIDRDRYMIIKAGKEIILPRKEFELLSLLSTSPRKVFTRKEISELIWGYEIGTTNRTIDVHIRKLRKKLGEKFITTVKGIGYRLEM